MEVKFNINFKTLISPAHTKNLLFHISFPKINMSDSQTLAQDSIETLNNNITLNPDSDPSRQSSKSHTASDQPEKKDEELNEQEEEEEGECGFCLFMKGGECKEQFVNWEKCMDEAEELKVDIVEKCFEVTQLLKKCMEANSDYYAPILSAEKSAQEEALNELEKEKMNSDQNEVEHSTG